MARRMETIEDFFLAAAADAATGSDYNETVALIRRTLPELQTKKRSMTQPGGVPLTISQLLGKRDYIEEMVTAGRIDELIAEADRPIAEGGWTQGDLKRLCQVRSHRSARDGWIKGSLGRASLDSRNVEGAISSSNLGVWPEARIHTTGRTIHPIQAFGAWGHTWATICASFQGMVALMRLLREGGLEAKDIADYRDKEAFQSDYETLENQPYIRDICEWDPKEYLQMKPEYDSKVDGSENEPLFLCRDLAVFMTEEVFGGIIQVTKDNFLQHKEIAEEIRAKQKAFDRAWRITRDMVEDRAETPLFFDIVVNWALAGLAGLASGGALFAFLKMVGLTSAWNLVSLIAGAVVAIFAASELRGRRLFGRRVGAVMIAIGAILATLFSCQLFYSFSAIRKGNAGWESCYRSQQAGLALSEGCKRILANPQPSFAITASKGLLGILAAVSIVGALLALLIRASNRWAGQQNP